MTQLTNEENAKVVGMHYGADVFEDITKHTCKLIGVDSIRLLLIFPDGLGYRNTKRCKLLLTPLSAISDEDAEQVRKMEGYSQDGDISIVKGLIRQRVYSLTHPTYIYLINKGYDTPLYFSPGHPCNAKTAIELGIAIDKTTL